MHLPLKWFWRRLVFHPLENLGYTVRLSKSTRSLNARKELARLSLLPQGRPTVTNILGPAIHIPCPRTFRRLYMEIWERQLYRLPVAGDPKPSIIDAGANIGLATLFLKNQFPDAEIVAIEADPDIATMLSANLSALGVEDVTIHQAALNASGRAATFLPEPGGTAGHLVSAHGPVRVPGLRLSSLILDLQPVFFLKLDIEGAELEVLQESQAILSKVKFLFVEYHLRKEEHSGLAELLTILDRSGFDYLLESGRPLPPSPFVNSVTHKGMKNLVHVFAINKT